MYCYIFILAITLDKADAVKTPTKNYNIRFIDEQTNNTSKVCITSKIDSKMPAEGQERNTRNTEDSPSNHITDTFLKRNEVIETQFSNILIICPKIKTNRTS